MSKDYFKRITIVGYTAWDIGCGCYTPKHETQYKKILKRRARRVDKMNIKKEIENEELW